ncbi:TrkA C-terminal domain-containing protein, partial [Roseiflexus sp.]
ERESALVIDVQRNGENLLLPDLDLCLASGDHVTLLAPIESIQRIRNRGMRN